MLITPGYAKTQRLVHKYQPSYGTSTKTALAMATLLHEGYGVESIIDYGCGKGRLKEHYKECPIWEYDPVIEGKDNPRIPPADAVLCCDVMEHIERECVPAVLEHMRSIALYYMYLTITTRPARKVLPDGRNAHITLMSSDEWRPLVSEVMTIITEREHNNEFTILGRPHEQNAQHLHRL